MKIVFFEVKDQYKDFFVKSVQGHDLSFSESILTEENAGSYADCEIVSTFIYSKVNQICLDKLPNVKLIVTRSTGFDHIDLKECRKRGIVVCNVPFYGENTVAEHTFALLLSLSRKIHKSYIRTINDDFSIENLTGFDLRGKTLGVIGTGHIGIHVIKIAKGFGMHVHAYDLRQDPMLAEVLHYKYTDLDEVLKTSDIISLHLPAIPATNHFINADKIWKMKRGVIILNTSRGTLIDTDALFHALKEGQVGGAGLDVIEGEEYIKEERQLLLDSAEDSIHNQDKLRQIFKNKAIFSMENVVFTPHNAFNSIEAIERIMATSVDNIHQFVFGKAKNRVDLL